ARSVATHVFTLTQNNLWARKQGGSGLALTAQPERRLIFEDRIRNTLAAMHNFGPTAAVGWLSAESIELLRYLPDGIRRLAVVHCDHKMFYDAVCPYGGCLDGIVAVSSHIATRLREFPELANVPVDAIPNGVAVPDQPVAPNFQQPLRIISLGRLGRGQKRVHLFPVICRQLMDRGISFTWTIAGEGEERENLERQMPSCPPAQQVVFAGSVPHAQIPALLQKHDVFLLTSDSEGLPMSLLEAMAHGLVPVVSDLESGIRDVVNAANGLLV